MIAAEPVSRWFVVQTHVGARAKAAANLDRQGFGVYLPRYLKGRSQPRRVGIGGGVRCFSATCSSRSIFQRKVGALYSINPGRLASRLVGRSACFCGARALSERTRTGAADAGPPSYLVIGPGSSRAR
jgi:hypothetical protein